MLAAFFNHRNQFAAQIYKVLIDQILEESSNEVLRESYLQNMVQVYSSIGSIPVNMLVESLIQANLLESKHKFAGFDFNFFMYISKHSRLSLRNGVLVAE